MTAAQAREISLNQVEAAGGLSGAINKDAEEVFGGFPANEQAAITRLFQRITEKSDGEKPIRKPETLHVLADVTCLNPVHLQAIVDDFAARNLLVLRQLENGEIQVDLPHECLGWKWERLKRWIDEEAALAKSLEFLKESARKEQRLTGSVLVEARQLRDQGWLKGLWPRRYLSDEEQAAVKRWIDESEQREEAERQRLVRDRRRARWTALAAGLVALSLGGLFLVAWNLKGRADRFAEQARKNAEQVVKNAEAALAQAKRAVYAESVVKGEIESDAGRPDQAAAYFARALRSAPDSLTATSWISSLLLDRDQLLTGAPLQHRYPAKSAAFSPDGRRVLTASNDLTARVWEADTGKPVGAPLQHRGSVNSAVFSPDGQRVVTASSDNTAQVWETDTGKPVGAPLQHRGSVNSAAFSPDGRRVVTASNDKTARVWETETGKPVGPPMQHQVAVNSAAFSPDGRRVVTASDDETARVWEADTGKPVGPPLQHQGYVISAAFSPDSRRVLTVSSGVRVWEADTGKPVGAPIQQKDVLSAAFSPDGRRVVTASYDHTARLWEAGTGKPVGAPLQHQEIVHSAAFSPDGRRVVTASNDLTARVWEADSGKPVGTPLQHQDWVNSAKFSPDGRRVVTASGNAARVWTVLIDCCASHEEADRLASLAEAVSGNEVSDTGSLTVIDGKERLQKLIRESGTGPAPELSLDWLIRRVGAASIRER
jgi:WD40 repeat protein